MVTARRDRLELAQGVIFTKQEETVKMYGHKVSIETAFDDAWIAYIP
jgi:hypothetical protein